MAALTARILVAALLAGLAGSAAAALPTPVGSLCNADGLIEVLAEVSTTPCLAEPDKEMKALFKAQTEFQGMRSLSVEKKLQIDGRIERRVRELRKLKATKKA
jgi:hypothetical protein